ncbi:MAG: hypothetical protein H7Y32_03800 [Chloroflexales bacterium]|nr:hypothetical protein [Chloroflexales bacterium]
MFRGSETVVAVSLWERILVWVAFPVLGAGAAWLLYAVADWVVSLPWAPFQGPFKLVASFPDPQGTIGALVVGAGAGLVLAFLAAQERLTVTVSDDQITIERGGSSRVLKRASISAVFLDRKQLVLLSPTSAEVVREASDLNANHLTSALRTHGYPWLADGDPYNDTYRRWVEDTPEIAGHANALLKARARALDKSDDDETAQLRTELANLGIVVRDEKKRQYWRHTEPTYKL